MIIRKSRHDDYPAKQDFLKKYGVFLLTLYKQIAIPYLRDRHFVSLRLFEK
jgi:hypothetical protein